MASFFSIQHHLVLVGGGHSHVDVLRVWAREPVPRVRLSVVTDTPRAVYSAWSGSGRRPVSSRRPRDRRRAACPKSPDYAHLAAGRAHFGDFDPFGDFDLILGAARLNLRIVEIPVRDHERTYGAPNIRRFADGWLILRMSARAAGRLFFTA